MSSNKNFNLERFKSNSFSWKYFFYSILGLLALVLVIKIITFPPNNFYSNNKVVVIEDKLSQKPIFPDQPGKMNPIDTNQIITIPEDPLEKRFLGNLLNVYLHKDINIEHFAENIISEYINDSIGVTYYAEEYKRVQFSVPTSRRDSLKKEWSQKTNEVKFVCYESVFDNQQITSNDPGFNNQEYKWFYEKIDLFNAWAITKGDKQITIAVIDDSFDDNHTELKNQIIKPWNVFDYSAKLETYNGKLMHGTHVAGTVLAEADNGFGISGVAPNCNLMPIQISDKNGMMTTTSILDGIFYALKNGASVINLSLGLDLSPIANNLDESQQQDLLNKLYPEEAEMWNEVYEIASKEGVVIVQAAGNSNVLAGLDPMKRSDICIVVGASDINNKKATFSNYGGDVDIYAPGVQIYSSTPENNFDFMDGTSMASPIISGCVALIKSVDKDLTATDIKNLLIDTSSPLINNNGKVVNINNALQNINNYARN